MDLSNLVAPVVSLGGLGLVFGALLGYASNKFKVEVDERIPLVRECLPGANCGGCGFAGCDAYAEAVVMGTAPTNKCSPGGAEAVTKISSILGVEASTTEPMVAFVRCKGTPDVAREKYNYIGILDCNQASVAPGGGSKTCEFGCLGLGSCVKACEFGALSIVNGVASIDDEKCVACGACISACPKTLIHLVPKKSKVRIDCNNKSKGKEVMDACDVGCIGCGICMKNCPKDAIEIINNIPVFDYNKCVNCGICANKCPKNSILNLKKPVLKKEAVPAPSKVASESTSSPENNNATV
ncbi:Fe-S cluster domain-containing protein [Clostridium subterminale]|uniref:Ion-translocating oxidoreductase complex subunit B n=1 Tax=Clostridium subterminale TaxID=1550 RepID=A0ABN1KYX6_CLOSU